MTLFESARATTRRLHYSASTEGAHLHRRKRFVRLTGSTIHAPGNRTHRHGLTVRKSCCQQVPTPNHPRHAMPAKNQKQGLSHRASEIKSATLTAMSTP